MKPIVTVTMLNLKGACLASVLRFQRLFGDRVEITVEKCVFYAHEFDFEWACDNLLSEEVSKAISDTLNWCDWRNGYMVTVARLFAEAYIKQWYEYEVSTEHSEEGEVKC